MFSVKIDETGKKYGRLRVLHCLSGKPAKWKCMCICGNTKVTTGTNLRRGATRSCGCLRRESARIVGLSNTTHGHSKKVVIPKEFSSWRAMLRRCLAPNCHAYPRYGGAVPPVKVCKRWMKFCNFLKDMGIRPEGTSLGRLKGLGNYGKSNCAWMTRKEQGIEQRKKRRIEHGMDFRTING